MANRQAYSSNTPVPGNASGYRSLVAIGGAVAIVAGDLALNATTALFKAPANFTVVDMIGKVTDMDTNGAPALVIDVGISGTPGLFISGSTVAQAAAALPAIATTGVGYRFTADTDVEMKATTAAATAAAGTLTLYLIGYFD